MANKKVVTLQLTAAFDPDVTNEDEVCSAVEAVLATALSTEGILNEVGNPDVSGFEVVESLNDGD